MLRCYLETKRTGMGRCNSNSDSVLQLWPATDECYGYQSLFRCFASAAMHSFRRGLEAYPLTQWHGDVQRTR